MDKTTTITFDLNALKRGEEKEGVITLDFPLPQNVTKYFGLETTAELVRTAFILKAQATYRSLRGSKRNPHSIEQATEEIRKYKPVLKFRDDKFFANQSVVSITDKIGGMSKIEKQALLKMLLEEAAEEEETNGSEE